MKVKWGGMVGLASGSLGPNVASHNRYGAYLRARVVPTASYSQYAQDAKANLAGASQSWGNLTAAQRLMWRTWAQTNPITDRIGDKQVLDGHAAFTMLAARMLTAGDTPAAEPPVIAAPTPPLTLAAEYDIGAGDFEINFTPTPFTTGVRLLVWAAVVNSPGIEFVENLYKLVLVTAAAPTSPISPQSSIEARFGTLIVGQRVFYRIQAQSAANGQQSIGLPLSGTVVST